MIAPDARDRPADAVEARERLISVSWPAGGVESEPSGDPWRSESPVSARLERTVDGGLFDLWTGRRIERVPLSEANHVRARAFARAVHRALQPVLRVDREGGFVWLDGSSVALSRALTPHERARLVAALAALQAAGGDGADLDPSRVRLDVSGDVLIAFDNV